MKNVLQERLVLDYISGMMDEYVKTTYRRLKNSEFRRKNEVNRMNKLFGFFELKDSLLPTIPWKIYNKDTKFDADILWTVRTAVHHGEDLNLPRCVGAVAGES